MTPHVTSRRGGIAMFVVGLLGIGAFAAVSSGGCSGGAGETAEPSPTATAPPSGSASTPPPGSTTPPAGSVCGDGVCVHESAEDCTTCAADCGACAVCGDGVCESAAGRESCDSCAADCGACSECGDGACSAASDEDCTTCARDCGECATCGNGACDEGETCDSCAKDCGPCSACGDGQCQAGETCDSCDEDCGSCVKCGDQECNGDETCKTCAKDCGQCQRAGCVQGAFKPFWGNLHAHSHLSHDADGTPAAAFHHARNVTKPALDFMWLSDHRGDLTPTEWKSCLSAANKATTADVFAAGCGFEKSVFGSQGGGQGDTGGIGHFNVLFPNTFFDLPFNIPGIYKQLDGCETCLGQFNHPGFPGTPGKTFDSHKFYPVGRDKVRLIEFNGPGSLDLKLDAYFEALGNGWMVSPSWNEDNHHKGWGDTTDATLVWATKLTRPDLRTAVKAHRSVATNDDTASLRMMADEVCWMGSELRGLGPTTITVELRDKQPGDGFTTVKLLGPNRKELGSAGCQGKNPCKVQVALTIKSSTYVVAVARQEDGDVLISAPIWYDP